MACSPTMGYCMASQRMQLVESVQRIVRRQRFFVIIRAIQQRSFLIGLRLVHRGDRIMSSASKRGGYEESSIIILSCRINWSLYQLALKRLDRGLLS